MAEYLTTREVAKYLRLNEKKVYDLVAKKQLPAARISGKWLFPLHLVDQWVADNTVYPTGGLMGAMLEDMVVIQGSDDWLLSRASEHFQDQRTVPVLSTRVGSLAGLEAVGTGLAHLAGCHVGNDQVEQAMHGQGCCLVTLFERSQGLILDRNRHPGLAGLEYLEGADLTFAARQPQSGTHQLTQRLLQGAGVDMEGLSQVGPFSSHLELALAIQRGEADVGMGTGLAAEMCGLDFVELHTEAFKVAVPLSFVSHPRLAAFLEFVLEDLKEAAGGGVTGYTFGELGHMEMVEHTS
ncbi:substrate-binding domain-containing protein [Candidatus Latescibacterota bacterium]